MKVKSGEPPTGVCVVSLVIAALMTIVSLTGLLYQAVVYPTPELLRAFVPSDVINLFIGVPALLGSMWLARRGKLMGLLFWPGALFYTFYTYLNYVFAMPLNAAFLLHLALVTSGAYTMLGVVASIDREAVRRRLIGVVPARMRGAVLAGLGILFAVRVIVLILQPLITTAQFVLGDVLVVSVMGMVCLVPLSSPLPAGGAGGWLGMLHALLMQTLSCSTGSILSRASG